MGIRTGRCRLAGRGNGLSATLLLIGGLLLAPFAARAGLFSDEEARKAATDLRAEVLQRRAADDTRFARIESNIDALQQSNQKLQESIDRLEQSIRNLGLPALASQIDGVSQDLARLRGQVEVQGNQVDQTQKHSKEFYLDLDTRLRVIEQERAKAADAAKAQQEQAAAADAGTPANNGIVPPVPVAGAPAAAGGPATPVVTPPTARETQAYDAAYKLFKAANYPAAIRAFQAFGKSWPNSSYAPNAGFWMGMAQYRQKAYGPAAAALQAVASAYPDSPKAPDALLNLSSVQLEQGDTKAAHHTLEDLLNRYPSSEAAAKAKARLGRS
ncbi:MAG: tol-pal system protein YbgF [Pseudomonadota bacterium]|nr:tol-pal system protein YbgF [Pseudomonadota bacterium]